MNKKLTIATLITLSALSAHSEVFYFSRGFNIETLKTFQEMGQYTDYVYDKNFSNIYNWYTSTKVGGETAGGDKNENIYGTDGNLKDSGFNSPTALADSLPGINDTIDFAQLSNRLYKQNSDGSYSSSVTTVYTAFLDMNLSVQAVRSSSGHNKINYISLNPNDSTNYTITLQRSTSTSSGKDKVSEVTGSNNLIFEVDVNIKSVADANGNVLANTLAQAGSYTSKLAFTKNLTVEANENGKTSDLNLKHGKAGNVEISAFLTTAGNVNVSKYATSTNDTWVLFNGSKSNAISGNITISDNGKLSLAMTNNALAFGDSKKTLSASGASFIDYQGDNQIGKNVDFSIGKSGTASFVVGEDTTNFDHSLLVSLNGKSDTIGKISFSDASAKLILDFGENDIAQIFHFSDLEGLDGASFVIENYSEGSDKIYVDTELSDSDLSFISFKDYDGNVYINKVDGESFYQISIPEPSTYAAILGVFALVFIFCKRRK